MAGNNIPPTTTHDTRNVMLHKFDGTNWVRAYDKTSDPDVKFAAINCASSGDNEIVAAVASKKIRVLHVALVVTAAVNTKWKSGASTDISGDMNWDAASKGYTDSFEYGLFETAAGEALNLNLSGAVAVDGHITYKEI